MVQVNGQGVGWVYVRLQPTQPLENASTINYHFLVADRRQITSWSISYPRERMLGGAERFSEGTNCNRWTNKDPIHPTL